MKRDKFVAEILYPPHLEGGKSFVGACVLNAGQMTAKQRRALAKALPPEADVIHHDDLLRIEIELPAYGKTRRGIKAAARQIFKAIRASMNILADFCPVNSSRQILLVTRRG